MAQARYASIHSGSSHRSGNSKYDRDERRFEENNNGSRRSETSKYDRDEKRFTGKLDPAKSMRYQQLSTKHTVDKIARGFTDVMAPIADKVSKNTARTLSDMYDSGSQAIKDGADFISGFVSSASDWIKPNKS